MRCKLIQTRAKTFHRICRILLIYDLRYNRNTRQLERKRSNWCLRFLIHLLLVLISTVMSGGIVLIAIFSLITNRFFTDETSLYTQQLVLMSSISVTRCYSIAYLLKMAVSPSDRKFLEHLLINVWKLKAQVRALTGADVRVLPQLRTLLRLKHVVVSVQLCVMSVPFCLAAFPLPYFLLIEFSYYAYQTMQLTLLSLHRDLNALLERGNHRSERRAVCTASCRKTAKRLHRVMLLLYRLGKAHAQFTTQFHWYPKLIYLTIFSCIFNISKYVVCLFLNFKGDSSFGFSVFAEVVFEIPFIVLPWLKMGLMASINDSHLEEAKFSLDLCTVAIAKLPAEGEDCGWCKSIKKSVEAFLLHTQLHPPTLNVFRNTSLDRQFAWHFAISSIQYALTCAQFEIIHAKECQRYPDRSV